MKVLLTHNFYQQPGGEDVVLRNEADLLRTHGHEVVVESVSNDSVKGVVAKTLVALNAIYSLPARRRFTKCLRREKPDIVHVHNFFPLYSPSIFSAAKSRGAATVFTLHNYRTLCPTASLTHNGKVDERSLSVGPFWAVRHKVYRQSFLGTLILALMIAVNKRIGTWRRQVDCFIALTEFSRRKFIEAGFPANKIAVKPNSIPDPHAGVERIDKRGGYAIYVGRLSDEKGVARLLEAWRQVDWPLKIVGDGPLMAAAKAEVNPAVELLGFRPPAEVQELIQHADFLVMPSEWYEGFPVTLLEAFANATPVIASRIGSLQEIVVDGANGLHFTAADVADMVATIQRLLGDEALRERLGAGGRRAYLDLYTPGENYRQLDAIYRSLVADR